MYTLYEYEEAHAQERDQEQRRIRSERGLPTCPCQQPATVLVSGRPRCGRCALEAMYPESA